MRWAPVKSDHNFVTLYILHFPHLPRIHIPKRSSLQPPVRSTLSISEGSVGHRLSSIVGSQPKIKFSTALATASTVLHIMRASSISWSLKWCVETSTDSRYGRDGETTQEAASASLYTVITIVYVYVYRYSFHASCRCESCHVMLAASHQWTCLFHISTLSATLSFLVMSNPKSSVCVIYA